MKTFNELEKEAKRYAAIARAEAGLGNDPIADIFGLIEGLDILYVRYPAGDNAVEGYVAQRGGRTVIFTNSSYGRGKEIFTAAHELGHLYMDLRTHKQNVVIDERITFEHKDEKETKANIFAANFLMPESTVFSFYRDRIQVEPNQIMAKHVVLVQQYFQVSFQAALFRLKNLNLVTKEAYENAYGYDGCSKVSELVRRCGYDTKLLFPDEDIHVPSTMIQKLIELYENERIPFGSLNYFMNLIGQNAEDLGIYPREAGEDSADE